MFFCFFPLPTHTACVVLRVTVHAGARGPPAHRFADRRWLVGLFFFFVFLTAAVPLRWSRWSRKDVRSGMEAWRGQEVGQTCIRLSRNTSKQDKEQDKIFDKSRGGMRCPASVHQHLLPAGDPQTCTRTPAYSSTSRTNSFSLELPSEG